MKILYIEPYYGDSHRQWIESYQRHSNHDISILKLPGNKWKWRMHGGAITLAQDFRDMNESFDLILCSDFLNLPVFKALAQDSIGNTPVAMYFHENQITYPWPEHDPDRQMGRDLHYHYINQTSALCSDWCYFNSAYNRDSFIDGVEEYLKKMPDHQNLFTLDTIKEKSSVLHLGCELTKFNKYKDVEKSSVPNILWNHRWEYDKNPESFFKILYKLKDRRVNFNLIVLGESFSKYPEVFDEAKEKLKNNIVQFGYCDSFEEYAKWLWRSDIMPVTSNQDFFGVSIVEGAYCNAYPILPNRLAYPEIFDISSNPEIFYNDEKDLMNKLKEAIIRTERLKNFSGIAREHDFNSVAKKYDNEFNLLIKSAEANKD